MKQPQARNTTLYTGIVKALRTSALVATFALSVSTTALAQTGDRARFDIPEQPLPAALRAFAEQADMQLLYRPETINGPTVRALRGELDKRQALQRLLEGTDLEVVYSADNAATIRPRGKEPVTKEGNTNGVATEVTQPQAQTRNSPATTQLDGPEVQELERLTVTGTRIRGGETPSPVITIGAENIREEGLTDLGEAIRSVPQNFTGGQNPGVQMGIAAGGNYVNQNWTGGSALNLRGLGPDASLTLLNGRRMSYSGHAQAVDISAIPVEAVDRIEIVADGASAIYGSDAVGGVGNVILKRDFDGLTLGARYGTATDGGMTTREYNATAGTTWSSGGLIATYRYASVDPIYASDREYTRFLLEPTTIYPGSHLRSGLLSARQMLGGNTELRLDALRTQRDQRNNYYYSDFSTFYSRLEPETTTSLVAPSVDIALSNDWSFLIGATWGEDKFQSPYIDVAIDTGARTTRIFNCYCNESRSWEVGAEGPFFALRGGDARLAVGVGRRTNDFLQFNYLTDTQTIQGAESSRFAYAEINLPLAGPDARSTGVQRLALTAAARSEDYDTFGRVTTPKLGLIYGPSAHVTMKVSWGKSFKAPTLFQRYNASPAFLVPPHFYGGFDYPAGSAVIILGTGNPDLDAERASSWTASLAFHPEALPGLEAELTWFDIDYTDRVIQPITNWSGAMTTPAYAQFIEFAPSAERQAAVIAAADFFSNATGEPYDPGNVIAIIDPRYVNASRQRIKGVDLTGSYRFDLGSGRLIFRGSASWIDSTQQIGTGQPRYDLAGTLFNPAKLNSRAGAVWAQGGFTASAFANYISGVTNTDEGKKTGSFTTIDTTLRYAVESGAGSRPGWDIALSAQNLLDRAPPLHRNITGDPYMFSHDSTNYSAIGRFLNLSIAAHW